MIALWKKIYDKPKQCIKKQRHHFADKRPYTQSYSFSNSHEWMWELDPKESWTLKNWFFQIVVLEKTLESPLDCTEIKPVSFKVNQPWIFSEKSIAEAEAPVLWPPDMKSRLTGRDPVLWKTEGRRRREWQRMRSLDGITDSTDGTPGIGNGQGGLAWCSSWSHKESDMTEWLNWTKLKTPIKTSNMSLHSQSIYYSIGTAFFVLTYINSSLPQCQW